MAFTNTYPHPQGIGQFVPSSHGHHRPSRHSPVTFMQSRVAPPQRVIHGSTRVVQVVNNHSHHHHHHQPHPLPSRQYRPSHSFQRNVPRYAIPLQGNPIIQNCPHPQPPRQIQRVGIPQYVPSKPVRDRVITIQPRPVQHNPIFANHYYPQCHQPFSSSHQVSASSSRSSVSPALHAVNRGMASPTSPTTSTCTSTSKKLSIISESSLPTFRDLRQLVHDSHLNKSDVSISLHECPVAPLPINVMDMNANLLDYPALDSKPVSSDKTNDKGSRDDLSSSPFILEFDELHMPPSYCR